MLGFLAFSTLIKGLISDPDVASVVVDEGVKRGGAALSTAKGNSTAASAQRTMIKPVVCIDANVVHQEYAHDLMTIIQLRDIQNALTHLALKGSVGAVSINSLVDTINPNRRAGLASLSGLENFNNAIDHAKAEGLNKGKQILHVNDKAATGTKVSDGKMPQVLTEYVPLALGRTVMAVTEIDGKQLTFPLTFRQVPYPMDSREMERIFLSAKGEDTHQMRLDKHSVGMITTPQLLRGTDITKEKFKVRFDDLKSASGYVNDAIKSQRDHVAAAVMTGKASMNNLANTFVISEATARQIELTTGKRFSNVSQRETLWKPLMANTIVVCNESRGLFTFYTMGVKLPEVYTRQDIKSKAAKESAVNSLQDIAALLNGGR